ncbi:MAG: hypothetical protein PHN19_00880 [Patescibacteria group bacterium]|nr:hypothetical protein [Patescibacteria group bacterium]
MSINKIKNKILAFTKKHPNLFVLLGYFFITIILSLPVLISGFDNKIPAAGSDAFQILGNIKNFQKSFINIGIDIPKFILAIINPAVFLDLKTWLSLCDLIFGEPFSYILFWFLSFPFAGLGCYMLTDYIVKNKLASFCAGLVFTFMPYHVAHSLGHFGATHIEFIPFAVLYLIKFFRNQSIKNIVLSILFTAIVFVNEPHYAIYLILFIVLLFGYFLIFERQKIINKKFLILILVFLVLSCVFALVFFHPMLKVAMSDNNFLDPGYWQTEAFSADFGSFFTPFILHSIWGEFFARGNVFISGAVTEAACFVGFSVLAFIILGIIYIKKEPDKLKYFFLFIGIFFSILAMGPTLHFFGHKLLESHMPYFYIYKFIPFFDNIRAVPRIFVFAMLSFSIIAAIGIKNFITNSKKREQKKYFIIAIVACVILIEFAFTMPTESIKVNDFYKKLDKTSKYSILEIPNSTSYDSYSKSMYYNSFHNKTILGNLHPARPTPNDFIFEKRFPVIKDLLYTFPTSAEDNIVTKSIVNNNIVSMHNLVLNKNQIKYVLLNKKYLSAEAFSKLINYIKDNIVTNKVIDDEELTVFEITNMPDRGDFLMYETDNWYDTAYSESGKPRKMSNNNSTLTLINYGVVNRKIALDFSVSTYSEQERILEVYINNNYIRRFDIDPKSFAKKSIKIDNIVPGENIIMFKIFDENNQLIENPEPNEALFFSNISYKEE